MSGVPSIKRKLAVLLIGIIAVSACTDKKEESNIEQEPKSSFNAELATKLGADEYGMRQYVMAFLKAGPNRDQGEEEAQTIQLAHRANISRLADEGKLSVAGPFMDDGEIRGIFIFNVTTIEEAKALTESDPAIKAGRLVMELHPWYGSAALMQVNETHKTLSK